MSRRRRLARRAPAAVLLALLALAAAPPPAAAQVTGPADAVVSERERSLLERLDSLEARTDSARAVRLARVQDEETRTREPLPLDTLELRLARIVSTTSVIERLRETAAEAEARILDRVPAFAAVGDRPVIPVSAVGSMRPPELWQSQRLDLSPPEQRLPGRDPLTPHEQVVTGVENLLLQNLQGPLPRPIRGWLGSQTVGGPIAEHAVYTELATSPAPEVQACFGGDDAACLLVLGLEGTDAGRTAVPLVSTRVRRSFTTYLLATDERVLTRLAAARSGAAGRGPEPGRASLLADASPRPLTEVAAGWRSRILESRPDRELAPRSVAAGLFWILLFTGLATRSTRWRLG